MRLNERRSFIKATAAIGATVLVPQSSLATTKGSPLMNDLSATRTAALDAAWKHYEQAVADARAALLATPRFRDRPDHRAQAYAALAEAQAMAYNFAVGPRLDAPQVNTHSWFSYFYTLGGTSPDFYYGTLFLDGKRTYKISGRFGDLKLILMQAFSHLMGDPRSKMLTNADFSTFDVEPDGSFAAIASANRHEGNWIPLDPGSDCNFFFIRRAIADWYGDRGRLDVEVLDGPIASSELDEEAMAHRIVLAGDFLRFLIVKWTIGIYDLYLARNGGKKNVLCVAAGESIASDLVGSPSTNYFWGVYEIGADEALIIDCEVPDAGYWALQAFDVWCRPYDFVHRQTDVNMSRAVIDGDGHYRAVVSLADPGVANWLDPAGRREGTITGRNYHSRRMPSAPLTKVVKLAELRQHLPPDTQYVTADQRRQALEYRRRGYATMYGD